MDRPPDPIDRLIHGVAFTGCLETDVANFLAHHGRDATVEHSRKVASAAARIARQYGEEPDRATRAGWLHDVSAVIPAQERIAAAHAWSIPVLPEEQSFPLIVHQKLSEAMARRIFGVEDGAILSAVGCHTTLRARPSTLDKVVFVADKIAWDREGKPPYLDALQAALDVSLDAAAYCYLDYMWTRRHELQAVHPWLVDAHQYLGRQLR